MASTFQFTLHLRGVYYVLPVNSCEATLPFDRLLMEINQVFNKENIYFQYCYFKSETNGNTILIRNREQLIDTGSIIKCFTY